MLAVLALALRTSGPVPAGVWELAALASLFALGAAVGTARFAATFGSDLLSARPGQAAAAEVAASASAFAGTALGAPISMTQALAGGLIGAAMHDSVRRVRWQRAARLALAWLLTVPAALGLAATAAWAADWIV